VDFDNERDVRAIEKMLDEHDRAYALRDWDRYASFFTEDAVWMPPGQPPLVGKDAWWSWIGPKWQQSAFGQLTVVTSHEEIVVAGDWAYEWHTQAQFGPGWQRYLKGILILQRQKSESWRIARYCFNHSPGPES
jgi:ketosteroid isomerase-like protein